jgi:hypothetical protein
LALEWQDIEVIVVDDGSTDDSWSAIRGDHRGAGHGVEGDVGDVALFIPKSG